MNMEVKLLASSEHHILKTLDGHYLAGLTDFTFTHPLTVTICDPSPGCEIKLGQLDSDNIGAILKENGTGSNLTGCDIKFVMIHQDGTSPITHVVPCVYNAIKDGSHVGLSVGGVTIKISSIHTNDYGAFFGKFIITFSGKQITYPSSGYVSVRINKSIY